MLHNIRYKMMQKIKNSPMHKLSEKYDSSLVNTLNEITDKKNFNHAELEEVARKTLVDLKQKNISQKDKVDRLDYKGCYKDNTDYIWFAAMNYTISIEKNRAHILNDSLEKKVSILIPRQKPLLEEDKNKKVEVYASSSIREEQVDKLLSILNNNLQEARISNKYKNDPCKTRGPHLKKTYMVSY